MKGERLFVERQSELLGHLAEEKDITIKFKLAFLRCFSPLGRDLEAVCQDFGIAVSTGYLWLRTWNDAGYSGISEQGQRTGRPPQLDEWDLVFLSYLLHQKTTWTTAEVRALIQRELGIEYSPAQVTRILRERLGMHFSKPFPRDYRRPPDAEERLKASLHQAFMILKQKEIHKDDLALGFLDETSPQNRANTVRVWSFESSPVLDKNTLHFKSNTIGFYAIQGISVQNFLTHSKEESIIDFLKQVRAANATAKAIVIILDNYSSHLTATVKETAQALDIYLVHLPPYSPDLNPIEYIWKSIKRIISREFIKTLDEMKEKIATGWKTLSGSLSFAKHWISEFLETDSYYMDLCI
ncbi:MAG TPA: IS630 family transposase [Saprospiraceae bacterium]|nr:IS630 family transposase [Saprospiraceae bacterium]